MPGRMIYHTSDASTSRFGERCGVTPVEWCRSARGQWHRVRTTNGMALCDRPVPAATQRRDLESPPRRSTRCQGCERFWPIFRWAADRVRIS